jgi:hypothetical protein
MWQVTRQPEVAQFGKSRRRRKAQGALSIEDRFALGRRNISRGSVSGHGNPSALLSLTAIGPLSGLGVGACIRCFSRIEFLQQAGILAKRLHVCRSLL